MVNFPIYLQYNNSPNLINLVQQTANSLLFQNINFTTDYLDILTATTAGLDNWGNILNQTRVVSYGLVYPKVFGYFNGDVITNTDDYPQNMYDSNFYNPLYDVTISLTDTQYRALLMLLYQKYTINNSISALNAAIQQYAFLTGAPGVPCVFSTYNMQITYQFNYQPLPYEVKLFYDTPLLPKPAGVALNLTF